MQSVESEHAAGMHRAWADSSGAQAAAATAANAATHLAESRPVPALAMSLCRLPAGSAVSAALNFSLEDEASSSVNKLWALPDHLDTVLILPRLGLSTANQEHCCNGDGHLKNSRYQKVVFA